jgi:hypothetical protein
MEIPTIRIMIGEIFAMFGVLEVWVPNSSRMTYLTELVLDTFILISVK